VHTGELWVVTWAEGICLFDGENWTVYNTFNSPLPSNHIRAVTQDHHGDIWIGTDNGVAVLKGLYELIPQEEPEPEKELLVYPNPTHNELFIDFPDSTWLNSTVRVFNMQGQQIYGQSVSDLSISLSLGSYSNGVYMVDIQNN
jgi:ligand-binding sensor domain-containing protein